RSYEHGERRPAETASCQAALAQDFGGRGGLDTFHRWPDDQGPHEHVSEPERHREEMQRDCDPVCVETHDALQRSIQADTTTTSRTSTKFTRITAAVGRNISDTCVRTRLAVSGSLLPQTAT